MNYAIKYEVSLIAIVISVLLLLLSSNVSANSCLKFSKHLENYLSSMKKNLYMPQGDVKDLESAYLIQKCLFNNSLSRIVGFKAGLMNKQTQSQFNVKEPVLGILLEQHINAPASIKLDQSKILLFEIELALKLKRDIESFDDIDLPIGQLFSSVAPAIEVANIKFNELKTVNVNDIVASNVGAQYIYIGEFISLDTISLKNLNVTVGHSSSSLENNYQIPNSYSDQIKWLLKKSYLEGYDLYKGMILLPGSITQPIILKVGVYRVKYKGLGEQSLLVQ